MYLFIFEDMSMIQNPSFTEEDASAVEVGIIEVIEFKDGDYYKYYDGKFNKVEIGVRN